MKTWMKLRMSVLCLTILCGCSTLRQYGVGLIPGGATSTDTQIHGSAGAPIPVAAVLVNAIPINTPGSSLGIEDLVRSQLLNAINNSRINQFGTLLPITTVDGRHLSLICPSGDVESDCGDIKLADKINAFAIEISPGLWLASRVKKD